MRVVVEMGFFAIADAHTAQEVGGYDVEAGHIGFDVTVCIIAHPADETAATDHDIDRSGDNELDATEAGADVDFLVFAYYRLAQIHAQAATEDLEKRAMDRLASIDVLIGSIAHRAVDAFAFLTDGQGALEPLVAVFSDALDNQIQTYINK
jgi:hypothetical protein